MRIPLIEALIEPGDIYLNEREKLRLIIYVPKQVHYTLQEFSFDVQRLIVETKSNFAVLNEHELNADMQVLPMKELHKP